MSFIVQSRGYYQCPEFTTLVEARAELKALVADSLAMARRKYPEATKHKILEDYYTITLGKDRQSQLWAEHHIQKA